MARNSTETKQKLLQAAAEEFATRGIAGARTGRVATAAGVNESLLFRYFGNKQELFSSVYDQLVRQTVEEVPFDPMHLAEYAGSLFDYYDTHREVLQLSMWARLERPDLAATLAVQKATDAKVKALRQAQEAGRVSDRLEAAELLNIIIQLSLTGTVASSSLVPDSERAKRRQSITLAVEALSAP